MDHFELKAAVCVKMEPKERNTVCSFSGGTVLDFVLAWTIVEVG